MEGKRTSSAMWAAAVVLLVVVLVASYTAGYFLRSQLFVSNELPADHHFSRAYSTRFEAIIFTPGAAIESAATGKQFTTTDPSRYRLGP